MHTCAVFSLVCQRIVFLFLISSSVGRCVEGEWELVTLGSCSYTLCQRKREANSFTIVSLVGQGRQWCSSLYFALKTALIQCPQIVYMTRRVYISEEHGWQKFLKEVLNTEGHQAQRETGCLVFLTVVDCMTLWIAVFQNGRYCGSHWKLKPLHRCLRQLFIL